MSGPALKLAAVTFRYPDGTLALDNVSLEIAEGSRVALLGANGAGKSTLLLCLNGLNTFTGAIEVGGVPVVKKNIRAIRSSVGLVFQNPDDQLFCPTVFDDIAFGPRNLGVPEAEVLKRVDAALHAVKLEGLEDKPAFHLSFGQKKRAALATVIATNPQVYVLDEPTSNLHPRARSEMGALLARAGGTQLIATHDFEFAREHCGRALLMAKGRIVADGTVEAVLGDRKSLEDAELV